MPQRTGAASSRAEQACPGEQHARPDTPAPSIGRRTGRLSTNDTPGADTTASTAPWSRSDQDAAADAGGAGSGLCPECERSRCARIFRITAGSCSVAIRRTDA